MSCMLTRENNSCTTDGFNSWKKATSKFLLHETSHQHVEPSIHLKLMFEFLTLLLALEGAKNKDIATNRLIVSQLIVITVY